MKAQLNRILLPDAELARAVADYRRITDKRIRNRIRTRINEIVVCGNFAGGNERMIVDFDRHGEENAAIDFEHLRALLVRLPCSVAVFQSCGGAGLKWIVARSAELTNAQATVALEKWLASVGVPVVADHNFNVASCRTSLSVDAGLWVASREPVPFGGRMYFEENIVEESGKRLTRLLAGFDDLLIVFRNLWRDIYSVGGGGYVEWLRGHHDFPERNETQVWRNLAVANFPKSLKDRVMHHVAQTNYLTRVESAHSGFNEGVYEMRGKKVAVGSSPRWIAGVNSGDCETVMRLLRSRFDDPCDDRQLPVLLAWLKRARERIRQHLDCNDAGITPPEICCPMLAIMGEQALGKTMIYKKVILPLLGGRDFDASKVLAQGDRFNAGIQGAEVMIIDDISTKDVARDGRAHFAQEIKRYLYGGQIAIEGKFENESMLDNHAICAVQLFNPEAIASTPDYSQAKDKVIFINCQQYEDLPEDRANDDLAWAELNREIERELPALAGYVDNYQLPSNVAPGTRSEKRNGMIHFCAAQCEDLLCENDRALILLQQYDQRAKAAIDRNLYEDKNWYGCKLPAKEIAERAEIKTSPEQAGHWMRELSRREDLDGRVEAVVYGTRVRGWIVHRPKPEIEKGEF